MPYPSAQLKHGEYAFLHVLQVVRQGVQSPDVVLGEKPKPSLHSVHTAGLVHVLQLVFEHEYTYTGKQTKMQAISSF
jgi:hypothetical protein